MTTRNAYERLKKLQVKEVLRELKKQDLDELDNLDFASLVLAYAMKENRNEHARLLKLGSNREFGGKEMAIIEESKLFLDWPETTMKKSDYIARAQELFYSDKSAVIAGNILAKCLIQSGEVQDGLKLFEDLIEANHELNWLAHSRYQSLVGAKMFGDSLGYISQVESNIARANYWLISNFHVIAGNKYWHGITLLFIIPYLNIILLSLSTVFSILSLAYSFRINNHFVKYYHWRLMPWVLFLTIFSWFVLGP